MARPELAQDQQLFDGIRGHSRLDEAIRYSARGAVALAARPSPLARLYRDYATHMLMTLALSQHYTVEGLTVGRLLALCEQAGLGSRGRAEALIAQLQDRGGLVAVQARGDRRRRPLVPTPDLLAFVQDRIRVDMEAAALVRQAAAGRLPDFDEPDFMAAYHRALTGAVRSAQTPLGVVGDELGPFSGRNGGLLALCDLLGRLESLSPSESVEVSVPDWSSRFGVSASHVRNLLRDAAAEGRIDWRPQTRRLSFTAGQIEAIRDFFAWLYFGLTWILGRAETARRAQAAPPPTPLIPANAGTRMESYEAGSKSSAPARPASES